MWEGRKHYLECFHESTFFFVLPKQRTLEKVRGRIYADSILPSCFVFTEKLSKNDLELPKFKSLELEIDGFPGLRAIVKHDDHAMTWYDHGDSYSPWYDNGKSIAWSS